MLLKRRFSGSPANSFASSIWLSDISFPSMLLTFSLVLNSSRVVRPSPQPTSRTISPSCRFASFANLTPRDVCGAECSTYSPASYWNKSFCCTSNGMRIGCLLKYVPLKIRNQHRATRITITAKRPISEASIISPTNGTICKTETTPRKNSTHFVGAACAMFDSRV